MTDNLELITFTDSAAHKVYELIVDENDENLSLRVYITGGGCSGFKYGFTFDNTINEDDTIIEKQISLNTNGDVQHNASHKDNHDTLSNNDLASVKLLIDPMSFQYLVGAEIDYVEDLQGSQFVIRNPNAKTTCGCGSSFSI